jgi:hypothetical protein
MLIKEDYDCQQQQTELEEMDDGPVNINEDERILIDSLKVYHSKQEYLYKWFQLFHIAHGWNKSDFSSELLFSDEYLLQLLS